MKQYGFQGYQADKRAVMDFKGGEDAALARLNHYMRSGALYTYKETRNGLLGQDNSSKFSPWLAQGSLSIRTIFHQVLAQKTQNASTKHMIDELFWRDFFIFYANYHGSSLFHEYGASGKGVHQW